MSRMDIVDRIRRALGMEEGEELVIHTPTFGRQDDIDVEAADAPLTPSEFDALRDLGEDELRSLGLQPWSETGDLWLLPAEWYPHIPDGVEVTSITGETRTFEKGKSDDDRRFGALPYGIVPRGEG